MPFHINQYNHSQFLNYLKHLLSLSSRVHGLLKSSRQGWRQSVFTKFRAASCHCFASCHCCHDPFIVRSPKLVHRSMVSLSFAHPSRCSRPMLTIVCFCAARPVPARFNRCRIILWWSVGSMISRIPIPQTFKVVAVQK